MIRPRLEPPAFWSSTAPQVYGRLLAPFAAVYALAGRLRFQITRPVQLPVPVICVGNLSLGGAGKTPVVRALAERLVVSGGRPHIVSRGYGGLMSGPHKVDPAQDDARAVGDEARMLAAVQPTWIGQDRAATAKAAVAAGASAILLDDGFQNPTLAKTASLLVVDGGAGFGNGQVFPAGPLREPVANGLQRADAVVIIGSDDHGIRSQVHAIRPDLPILAATLVPDAVTRALAGQRVVAFAGIGRPAKVFETLRAVGATVIAGIAFPDHHVFSADELADLRARAKAGGAILVTTEKDAARLSPADTDDLRIARVSLAFADEAAIQSLLARWTAGAPP